MGAPPRPLRAGAGRTAARAAQRTREASGRAGARHGELWPWLAVAGVGALHGLNPANGWMFAAAWGVHSRDGRRRCAPCCRSRSGTPHRSRWWPARWCSACRWTACFSKSLRPLLVIVAIVHLRAAHRGGARARRAGGAGDLVLPDVHRARRRSDAGAGADPPLHRSGLCSGVRIGLAALALGAIGVRTASMLAVTGVIAAGVCCALNWRRSKPQ